MDSAQGRGPRTLSLGIGRLGVLALAGCALAAAGSGGNGARADASPSLVEASLVFDGVTVVDVEQGNLVPDQRVAILGNRIQAVGATNAIEVPPDAQIVDARNKYLIPGLWDLHTHREFRTEPAPIDYLLLLANGVTGMRDAYSVKVSLEGQVQWWHDILAGTRIGPPRQLLTGHRPVRDYDDMASRKTHGANFLKLYPFSYAKAAAARRTGLPFGGHVSSSATAIEASDSGMTIIDHMNSAGDLAKLCTAPDGSVEQCRPVAERFKQNNTWLVPTMTRLLNARRSWDLPASQAIMTRLREFSNSFWEDSMSGGHGNWLRAPDAVMDVTSDSTGYLHILHRVGLPILAGSDADGTKGLLQTMPKGFALHAELAIYVAEGLTPLEALQSATLNPAKMLRGTDSLGSVAPGKLADLVLLDADPLADITNTTTIRAVVANGRYFDRTALDSLLTQVREDWP